MKSAFDHPAIGKEKDGSLAVKTSMGVASIDNYARSGGSRGFDVFHPNGTHIGYLREVSPSDRRYVQGAATPQFIAESTMGDSLIFLETAPIVTLVEALCKNAGRNPS